MHRAWMIVAEVINIGFNIYMNNVIKETARGQPYVGLTPLKMNP